MVEEKQLRDNTDATFAYKQKVKIQSGFFKGRWGEIESYTGKNYTVVCVIDDRKHYIVCKETDLRAQKRWF